MAVKFCQHVKSGFPACEIRFESGMDNITHLLENIYYFETRQSFAFIDQLEWVAQKFKKFEYSIVSNPKILNSLVFKNRGRSLLYTDTKYCSSSSVDRSKMNLKSPDGVDEHTVYHSVNKMGRTEASAPVLSAQC